MNTSPKPTNGNNGGRRWYRRGHRWVGMSLVVFVLYLSISGIALNHSGDLGLDRKYVSWTWLLKAYGLDRPAPYAGMVLIDSLVVVGDVQRAHILLDTGELVESIDLSAILPGVIERVGRAGDSVVMQGGGQLIRSDAEVSAFHVWDNSFKSNIEWSAEVEPGAAGLEAIESAWRGPGVTVERFLLDLHSGRILSRTGPLLMDIVAVFLIVLSVSGLIMSRVRNRRR